MLPACESHHHHKKKKMEHLHHIDVYGSFTFTLFPHPSSLMHKMRSGSLVRVMKQIGIIMDELKYLVSAKLSLANCWCYWAAKHNQMNKRFMSCKRSYVYSMVGQMVRVGLCRHEHFSKRFLYFHLKSQKKNP